MKRFRPRLAGKLGGQDSFESIESFESCERLTQSWSSQSSFSSLQRVPSYDSFDSEDYPAALHGHKPKGTFKDYVRERSDLSKDKPVIPAAALAGYTGKNEEHSFPGRSDQRPSITEEDNNYLCDSVCRHHWLQLVSIHFLLYGMT